MVTAYDRGNSRAKEALPPTDSLQYANDLFRRTGRDAVLILTDWKEFANIDLAAFEEGVKFPIVIDGRNLYHPQRCWSPDLRTSRGRPANYLAQEAKLRKAVV